jgi:cysteine-rich repeat protein
MRKKNKKSRGSKWNFKVPIIVGSSFLGGIIVLAMVVLALSGRQGIFSSLQTMIFPSTFTPGGSLPGYGTGRTDGKCGIKKNTCERGSYRSVYFKVQPDLVNIYDRWACSGLEGGKNVLCKSVRPGAVDSKGHVKTRCHLSKPSGGYLINFNKSLISDRKDSTHTDHFTVNARVKAGKYKIKLESFDGYIAVGNRKDRKDSNPAEQSKEQYYVEFKSGNNTVAKTEATKDLKDGVTQAVWKGVVNNELNINKNTSSLLVKHVVPYVGKWKRPPHSVMAVCMSMEPIEDGVDGECGTAASSGAISNCSESNTDLCKVGEPILMKSNVGPYTRSKCVWECKGENGGSSSSICSAWNKVCGDNHKEPDEDCDNGADNGKVCTPSYGDSCDYCDSSCYTQTVTGGNCGNGTIDGDEKCDDGNQNGVIPAVGYGQTKEYCKTDCTKGTVTGGECGDGSVNGNERCDDGNTTSGDGCSATCQKEDLGIRIDKTVSDALVKKGDKVTYEYKVTNNGEVELHDIKVSDDKLGEITCPKTTLAVDEFMDCTKEEVSIDERVTNVATVKGFDSDGKKTSDSDSVTVNLESDPIICGNGKLDSGEQCDDGNTKNGDGCSSVCKKEKNVEEENKDEDEDEDEEDEDCDASIGNYIWYDTNGNGVQEDIEEGIEGIKVCAYNGNHKYCDTTNSGGRYKIKNLCKHTYDVVVRGVDGMIQTYDPDGKKNNKTQVKLKNGDKHTKADFGYRGGAPKTGVATSIALLIGISTLLTIGILMIMRKKGQI